MSTMKTILVALIALIPTALAAPPVLEIWEGSATSHAFYAGYRTICSGNGPATLTIEREMESATFTVVVAATCVPTLTWRGILDAEGWRFEDALGIMDGGFFPTDDPAQWRLDGFHSNCPPGFICEFTSGVRIRGGFVRST